MNLDAEFPKTPSPKSARIPPQTPPAGGYQIPAVLKIVRTNSAAAEFRANEVGALTVIPVLAAFQYERSFKQTIFLSIIFSLVSVISGLFLSFYFALPSGGIIVVIALAIFLLSLILNTKGGSIPLCLFDWNFINLGNNIFFNHYVQFLI